jgi:hypothetical protein
MESIRRALHFDRSPNSVPRGIESKFNRTLLSRRGEWFSKFCPSLGMIVSRQLVAFMPRVVDRATEYSLVSSIEVKPGSDRAVEVDFRAEVEARHLWQTGNIAIGVGAVAAVVSTPVRTFAREFETVTNQAT